METIHVPRPPSEAFNRNRRVSDLIRAQTNHLKHLEDKMPASVRQQIPQHAIVTEADAASYIAAMTRLFRTQGDSAQPSTTAQVIPIQSASSLALAAAAGESGGGSKSKAASSNKSQKPRKSGAPRKEKKG